MGKTGKICLGRLGGDAKVSPLLATRPYALRKLKFDEDGFWLDASSMTEISLVQG